MKSKLLKMTTFGGLLALFIACQPSASAKNEGPFTSKFANIETSTSIGSEKQSTETCAPTCVPKERKHRWKKGEFMKNLSPEERKRAESIQEKAKADPEVQKAREALKNANTREEKREAFKNLKTATRNAISPEEQAFMDKIWQGQHKKHPKMTDEQKEKCREICDKLNENPEVQKAREARKNAKTPEERKAAAKKLHETMQKNMSAEDKAFMEGIKTHKGNKPSSEE